MTTPATRRRTHTPRKFQTIFGHFLFDDMLFRSPAGAARLLASRRALSTYVQYVDGVVSTTSVSSSQFLAAVPRGAAATSAPGASRYAAHAVCLCVAGGAGAYTVARSVGTDRVFQLTMHIERIGAVAGGVPCPPSGTPLTSPVAVLRVGAVPVAAWASL